MNELDIIGVRFIEAGPVSYCRGGELRLGVGDYVVVRTDGGERLGWVVIAADQVLASEQRGPLRVVERLATEADVEAWRANRRRAQEDIGRAQALAARADPRVRVASVEYDLAGERCRLTFAASDRVEHEWLRRQASELLGADVHVEQVGDRDRAKALGGVDVCGRALCCSSWMTSFPSISIKMAKDQGLSPNPTKISGVCGRLLCCLSFEVEAYRELRGDLPKVGKRITTPVGSARVVSINALSQMVRLRMDSGEMVEIGANELRAQYGAAVRPEELEQTIEEPLRRRERQRQQATVAVLSPVDTPAAARVQPPAAPAAITGEVVGNAGGEGDGDGAGGEEGAGSEESADGKRRRRRGRRGGRRRRRADGGEAGAPGAAGGQPEAD
ncbi:MAG: hypothetical protein EXR65_01675 [Dehalococcoidia bacterium]|nr:hypothetical protein [Dehalococcoidia bacterium]